MPWGLWSRRGSAWRGCHVALQPGACCTRLLRPCRRERPLEAGGGVGHGRGLHFSVPFLGMLQRFPVASQIAIKFPHFKRDCSPFTSRSASSFPPLPVSSAPSRQMASRPHRVPHWSQLPVAPPGLGSSSKDPVAGLDPLGTDPGRIRGSSPHHGVPPFQRIRN